MYKFIKKLITVKQIQKEVDTYECWSVEWISHTGDYYADRTNRKEFFTKEDDANIFHKNIVDAGKLLRYNALTVYPVKKEN